MEVDIPKVELVKLPKGKKRSLNGGDEEEVDAEGGDETEVMTVIPVEEDVGVTVAPLVPSLDMEKESGVIPVGPRLVDGPRVWGWDVV